MMQIRREHYPIRVADEIPEVAAAACRIAASDHAEGSPGEAAFRMAADFWERIGRRELMPAEAAEQFVAACHAYRPAKAEHINTWVGGYGPAGAGPWGDPAGRSGSRDERDDDRADAGSPIDAETIEDILVFYFDNILLKNYRDEQQADQQGRPGSAPAPTRAPAPPETDSRPLTYLDIERMRRARGDQIGPTPETDEERRKRELTAYAVSNLGATRPGSSPAPNAPRPSARPSAASAPRRSPIYGDY